MQDGIGTMCDVQTAKIGRLQLTQNRLPALSVFDGGWFHPSDTVQRCVAGGEETVSI